MQGAIDGHRALCKAPAAMTQRPASFTGSKGPAIAMSHLVDASIVAREVAGGVPEGTHDATSLRLMHLWEAMETRKYNAASPPLP